jgi:hypothetical protein
MTSTTRPPPDPELQKLTCRVRDRCLRPGRQRANVARGGLGANVPEDAVYPVAFVDAEGRPLNGSNKYSAL